MTRPSTEELAGLRVTRDGLGRHGDLFMRLNGFYRIGPDGPVEPEFGYRDFRDREFRQPIQTEAAQALADVAARVLELEAAQQWQPIETAPKDRDILVCQSRNGIISAARGVNEHGDWKTGIGPMDYLAEATHWMPLPEPPSAALNQTGGAT